MSGSSEEAAEAAARLKAEIIQQIEILQEQRKKRKFADSDNAYPFLDDYVYEYWFLRLYPFEGQYMSRAQCVDKCSQLGTAELRMWQFLKRSLDEGAPFVRYDSSLKTIVYLWPNIF